MLEEIRHLMSLRFMRARLLVFWSTRISANKPKECYADSQTADAQLRGIVLLFGRVIVQISEKTLAASSQDNQCCLGEHQSNYCSRQQR